MIVALATGWLLAAAPATAKEAEEPTATPAALTAPAPKPEKDPIVCTAAKPVGSLLPVKSCARKSDRDRQKRDSQEALQLIQRRADGPAKTRD